MSGIGGIRSSVPPFGGELSTESATVSDSGGRLLAKHRATEIVEIGSQISTDGAWARLVRHSMASVSTESARRPR